MLHTVSTYFKGRSPGSAFEKYLRALRKWRVTLKNRLGAVHHKAKYCLNYPVALLN